MIEYIFELIIRPVLSTLFHWFIETPRTTSRVVTKSFSGRVSIRDWAVFGWARGSMGPFARDIAEIEARESQRNAQSVIDEYLYAKRSPMRGGKEDPWGKTKR